MIELRWSRAALQDIQRLHVFIGTHNQKAAARAVDLIYSAAESLKSFPQKGRPYAASIAFREIIVPFGDGGYIIRYRQTDGGILVVRVWHGREDR